MTDYTNLQEKLLEAAIYHTTGAHGEKMFKEAAEAIKALVAERDKFAAGRGCCTEF